MTSRVTKAEAARRLGCNKSTVTRWVAKHPALADERGHVSVEDLRRHRDEVINPALQTRRPADVDFPVESAREAPSPVQVHRASLNDDRARSERLKADALELEMAERLGRTLARDDVEAAMAEVATILRQTAQQLVRDRSEAIARLEDVRATEAALDEMMRTLMDSAADAMAEAMDESRNAA